MGSYAFEPLFFGSGGSMFSMARVHQERGTCSDAARMAAPEEEPPHK
jgi:hypothetical protein